MEWTGERNEIFKGLDALYIPYNEGWDCHGRAMWRVCKVKNFDRIRRMIWSGGDENAIRVTFM